MPVFVVQLPPLDEWAEWDNNSTQRLLEQPSVLLGYESSGARQGPAAACTGMSFCSSWLCGSGASTVRRVGHHRPCNTHFSHGCDNGANSLQGGGGQDGTTHLSCSPVISTSASRSSSAAFFCMVFPIPSMSVLTHDAHNKDIILQRAKRASAAFSFYMFKKKRKRKKNTACIIKYVKQHATIQNLTSDTKQSRFLPHLLDTVKKS